MRLRHPLTLALRHLTPGRRIDGTAALPVWLEPSGRLDLPGLAARLRETFAAGLTPAVNLFAGSVDRLGLEQRMDVLATEPIDRSGEEVDRGRPACLLYTSPSPRDS